MTNHQRDVSAIEAIIHAYQLHPVSTRECPLLTISFIARGYTNGLRASLGLSYEAVGGLYQEGRTHFILNEGAIIQKTTTFVEEQRDIERTVFLPIQARFSEIEKAFRKIAPLAETEPQHFLEKTLELYLDYWVLLGTYNCFLQYIGSGTEIQTLTPQQIQRLGVERTVVASLYPMIDGWIHAAAQRLGRTGNFDGDLLRYFSIQELQRRSSLTLQPEDVPMLTQRRNSNFYLYEEQSNHEWIVDDQRTVEEIQRKYYAVPEKDVQVVRGFAVSSGVARGTVVNLSNKKMMDRSQIPRDVVIVTTMTHPTDTELIKRSKAVVTDEGGILSHAAVIAREFNIPCVIGTKIATAVFKDGVDVEVDADQGMVKIVS
jgi:phosphohistidine swiveling domain-containing protein